MTQFFREFESIFTPHPSPLPQGERGYPHTACHNFFKDIVKYMAQRKLPLPLWERAGVRGIVLNNSPHYLFITTLL
jgi:hypothetical protein